MAHRSLLLILLAPCATALLAPPARTCTVLNAQVGSSSRSRAFTKTGPRKPQSPRPEQYPNEQKLEDLAVKKRNIKYDPEYADDIARAKRRLFDLRMRKSQRLPFKSSEFRELRRFVARLKTQQREDELRAAGVDLKKKKPRTRRERQRAAEKRARQLAQKARNRERYGMEELARATADLIARGVTGVGGLKYKRVPRGFDKDHPRAELLKHDGLYAILDPLPARTATSAQLVETCAERFEAVARLHAWLVEFYEQVRAGSR